MCTDVSNKYVVVTPSTSTPVHSSNRRWLFAGCDNGNCHRDTCVCNEGFALDKTHKFCIPHCNPPCGNGYCSAPNTCTCNDGYEAISNAACRPVCPQGCELGECVAPGQCACRAGFKLHERKCVPHCERGCVNGDCVAPNTCTCAQGYTMDPSATRCEAKCEQPCLNGEHQQIISEIRSIRHFNFFRLRFPRRTLWRAKSMQMQFRLSTWRKRSIQVSCAIVTLRVLLSSYFNAKFDSTSDA